MRSGYEGINLEGRKAGAGENARTGKRENGREKQRPTAWVNAVGPLVQAVFERFAAPLTVEFTRNRRPFSRMKPVASS